MEIRMDVVKFFLTNAKVIRPANASQRNTNNTVSGKLTRSYAFRREVIMVRDIVIQLKIVRIFLMKFYC